MTIILKDGTGTGNQARVDANNRLRTYGVSETEQAHAAKEGRAFNVNTGEITLTSDSESALLYIKNNELKELHIESIVIGTNVSTGGSSADAGLVTIESNPTGGTLISGASAVNINQNRRIGDPNTLDVDAYKGTEGSTITGGTDLAIIYVDDNVRASVPLDLIIPKSQKISISYTPPAGNTSMNLYIALICHLENGDQ